LAAFGFDDNAFGGGRNALGRLQGRGRVAGGKRQRQRAEEPKESADRHGPIFLREHDPAKEIAPLSLTPDLRLMQRGMTPLPSLRPCGTRLPATTRPPGARPWTPRRFSFSF